MSSNWTEKGPKIKRHSAYCHRKRQDRMAEDPGTKAVGRGAQAGGGLQEEVGIKQAYGTASSRPGPVQLSSSSFIVMRKGQMLKGSGGASLRAPPR